MIQYLLTSFLSLSLLLLSSHLLFFIIIFFSLSFFTYHFRGEKRKENEVEWGILLFEEGRERLLRHKEDGFSTKFLSLFLFLSFASFLFLSLSLTSGKTNEKFSYIFQNPLFFFYLVFLFSLSLSTSDERLRKTKEVERERKRRESEWKNPSTFDAREKERGRISILKEWTGSGMDWNVVKEIKRFVSEHSASLEISGWKNFVESCGKVCWQWNGKRTILAQEKGGICNELELQ